MAPTEQAQDNHGELFPGHVSTLAVTDPELIEYFDNSAFDEVLREDTLGTRTRLMVQRARGYPRTLNAIRVIDEVVPAGQHT